MKRTTLLPYLLAILLLSPTLSPAKKSKKGQDSLRVTILGDSYSTFQGYLSPDSNAVWYPAQQKSNDVRNVEETWWWQVKERMGYRLETNNSFSGSTICYRGYRNEDYTNRSFVNRATYLGSPDVILVCGATNDSWSGAKVGEYKFGEWTNTELFTFRPAMAKLCWELRSHYPTAQLLFILNSELRPEINESVRIICRHYDIPLLELHDIEKQSGHPSIKGMKSFADQVVNYLKHTAN